MLHGCDRLLYDDSTVIVHMYIEIEHEHMLTRCSRRVDLSVRLAGVLKHVRRALERSSSMLTNIDVVERTGPAPQCAPSNTLELLRVLPSSFPRGCR